MKKSKKKVKVRSLQIYQISTKILTLNFKAELLQYYHMQKESEFTSAKTVKMLFNQIETAFNRKDSQKLTLLLGELYNDPAYNNNAQSWKTTGSFTNYNDAVVGKGFAKMMEVIKQFQFEKLKKGIHYAFKIHLEALSQVLKVLDEIKDEESVWICKPLRQVIRATKKIFLSAQKKDQQSGGAVSVKKSDLIIKLQQFKARRTFEQRVKEEIIPLIDNLQVSIMLLYHNYDQIPRITDNPKSYGEHGPAFVDNFYFQKAKTALVYEKFQEAELYFEKINIKTKGQKRLVLKYLIPCKMFLGKTFIRNPNCQQQYFPQYDPIIQALNKAKFSDYGIAIKKYQKVWIKRGIYLLMDKLRVILWRNLLKKVHKILGDDKLDMQKIHRAVKVSGGDQKLEECICVISNLIYEGYIKGYIFQNEQHKVLVLKKDGGFPSLSK